MDSFLIVTKNTANQPEDIARIKDFTRLTGIIAGAGAFYNGFMFFRRTRVVKPSFQERVNSLAGAGFTVVNQPGGVARVSRGVCAVDLKDPEGADRVEERA